MEGFDLGSIVAHIKADTTQFTAGLNQAKAEADGFAGKMTAIAAGAAAVVDVLVIGFGVKSVKAFSLAQEVTAQLNQVLTTTGKISTISTAEVHKLAMSLQEYSGQTHEAIEQGQTILLQFSGITKDTLPQASKAMVDLAQRMGVDTVTAAKQLGIALDDPAVGMTRLRRSGIDFTEDQKNAIKALKDSGDTAGAASMLMSILETKVGGAGGAYRNTLAGGVANAKNQLRDFEELLGGKIIKTLNEAFTWYEKHARILNDIAGVVGTLIGVLAGALILYGNWIILTKALTIAQAALNLIMNMNPIILGIMAVVIVAALLLEHWQQVKQWFGDFWGFVRNVFADISGFITGILNGIYNAIKAYVHLYVAAFADIRNGILGIFGGAASWLYNIGRDIIQGLINGVKDMAGAAGNAVSNIASGIKDIAKRILGVFSPSTVFHEIGLNVGQGLVNGMTAMQDAVAGASGQMAMAAVAPASSITNNSPTNNQSSVSTNIGTINIGSNADASRFLRTLTRNQELAQKGLTPVR